MRTRNKSFVDAEKLREVYSFQVYAGKKWRYVCGSDGKIKTYTTPEDRDAARAVYRKRHEPNA
jgi:transposase